MSAFPFAIDSLRHKIVFGYGAVAALVIGLSVFSLVDMRLLEAQITAGERVSQFFGIALEIRRFEKNYFLYRQDADFEENRLYVVQARRLLTEHSHLFEMFEPPERIAALLATLDMYGMLMAEQVIGGSDPVREAHIRQAGKEIVTIAENWSRAERKTLQAQLDRHRFWWLASIAAVVVSLVAIGQLLARRVARPLQQMEQNMAAVAAGRLAKLDMPGEDREIVSLVQAFNHVLHELDLRQGQLVRSEKLAALGTLLSGVAHELNNPLSNISTSCQILFEEVGAGRTAFEAEMIGQIDAEVWRARRIVRSLLDYARDRAFRRETVALAPLAADSLRLIKGQIPAHVAIETTIPAGLTVSGDLQRLQQVLFNLIGNALAALEGAGEIVIAAREIGDRPRFSDSQNCGLSPISPLLFGQCQGSGPAIEIEIRDNGHGIAPEILPRIFDPFFTTKDVGQGLGLGLFVVFEIIEEHGGCIAVNSAPGQGSTFLIRLPALEPTA